MKIDITHHAGKGSRPILPSKSAVDQLVKPGGSSVTKYAKAAPNVVQSGPNIEGLEP
jgi:hypothetical protein